MLALPEIPHGYDYEAVVVRGIVLGTKAVVAAGRAFFETYEKKPETEPVSEEEVASDSDPNSPRASFVHRTNKKKEQFSGNALRLSNLVDKMNLYDILAVSESCSGDDLKKSYRKLVLEKHPDKQQSLGPKEGEKVRTEFLRIQEAFEVLSDDRRRRMYDSSLKFDDTIPTEKEVVSDSAFFTLFEAAFRRNERWSVRRPVPSIGAADASREVVDKFYDFWFNKFETWRDFSHHDEHDLSHSESRDERRWMEVQNARIRKKKLAEENSRIRRLVDLAAKLDPRLKLFKQMDADAAAEEKRKRQAERNQRINAVDEKRQAEERKKLEKLMEQEIEKETLKAEKADIKRIRAEIRQVVGVLDNEPFNEALLKLLKSVELANEYLEYARAAVSDNAVTEFMDEVIEVGGPLSRTTSAALSRTTSAALSRTSSAPPTPAPEVVSKIVSKEALAEQDDAAGWTAEELQLLTRGMQKYPIGTNKRWEVIQSLIGSSKSVTEVIEMSKKVASKKVIEPTLFVTSKKKVETVGVPDVDYEREAAKAAPQVESGVEAWTPEQQKLLEEAMRKHPPTQVPAERWVKIAEEIPGKNKQQCVARFKYIRELIAKKK